MDPTIEYMWEQEKALHGKESGIACTVAVEASITEHYNDQIRELTNSDKEEHKKLMRNHHQVQERGAGAPRHRAGE